MKYDFEVDFSDSWTVAVVIALSLGTVAILTGIAANLF